MMTSSKKIKSNIITGDDILGKEALDPHGDVLGVVTQLHIDKRDKKLIGITIDMGFMKPDLFIGINYVKAFGIDAIFLKRVPADKFKGLKVITESGELIGKVKKIVKEKTSIKEFEIVGKKVFAKPFKILYSDIKEIGDQIILKKKYKIKDKD